MTSIRRNIFLISTAFFFIFFGFGTAQQYLVLVFAAQGRVYLALSVLFILYSTFLFTGIIVTKIIPWLGGLKKSLFIGAFTYFLFVASVAVNNTAILYAVSILIGVGAGLLWVSSGQIIADSSDEHTVGRNLAYQMIGLYSGNILGIYTGSYLIQTLSVKQTYLLLTLSILCGIFFLPGVQPVKEEIKNRLFKPYYMFSWQMVVLFPLIFGANFLQTQVFTAMNIIIVNLLGIGSVALLVTMIKVSNIVGSFSSGTISGWFSKAILLAILVVVAGLGIFLFIGTQIRALIFLGTILIGFSMAAIYPVCLAWLKEKLPAEEYLYALGVFHVYGNLGVLGAITANLNLSVDFSFIPAFIALFLAIPGIVLFNNLFKQRIKIIK